MFRPCSEINPTRGTIRGKGSRTRCPAPCGMLSGPTCSPWQPMGSALTHSVPRGATGPTPPGTASRRLRSGFRPKPGGAELGERAGPAVPIGREARIRLAQDLGGPAQFLPARTAVDPRRSSSRAPCRYLSLRSSRGQRPFPAEERRRPSAAAGLRSCFWRRRGFYRDRLVVTGISRLIHRKASAYAMTWARRQREI